MVTVPQVTETIIKRSRYLTEAFAKGIINSSALAKYIKPEIEKMLIKKTSQSSIIMAINRLKNRIKPNINYKNIFKTQPEIAIRSRLSLVTLVNSDTLYESCSTFFQVHPIKKRHFLTLTEGLSETTMIISDSLKKEILLYLQKETIISDIDNLSSITIYLPEEAARSPGVIYSFLKSLVWENVNIIEIVSTSRELTLVFQDEDINKAFSILKSLFTV
ncbi:MAG: hypothetical protein Q7R31_04405 [Candidatus Levybacteria bacterium]|nr:hypothetical protein [Candidatus Levybacteria bacterium]